MGFASYLEDIIDRDCESSSLDAEQPPEDPLERPRRLIRAFWAYYCQQQSLVQVPSGAWEGHFLQVQNLHNILSLVSQLHEYHPVAWKVVKDIEGRLRRFFQETQVYGPLSRSVFQRVYNFSRDIDSRCRSIVRELNQFHPKAVCGMPIEERAKDEIVETVKKLNEIREQFGRDLKEFDKHQALAKEAEAFWNRFLQLFTVLAVQRCYRPALQSLDRFHLNEEQERYVALDHKGGYRIQGASGSGKTIILIHRALRLARENPTSQVRIFTINRTLAELFRSTVVAIHGRLPPNVHVAAFYDFLRESVSLFEPRETYRLVDERSRERIMDSWRDFYNKHGQDEQQNVFAAEKVKLLISLIETRDGVKLDANRYLREEMVYVQSAYRKRDRQRYLTDHRRSRSIIFQQSQKEVCLRILQRWEEWLECGHLCDIDGFTLLAADHFEEPRHLARIRDALPTDFVLVDEVQDFSTLELAIVRKLVPDPEVLNSIFLVGDLSQKVYPKHHDSRWSGFNFRGRAGILRQNFRNTRQILKAALNLPQDFPPKEDEEENEILDPELSIYKGGLPLVLGCMPATHLRRVLEVVQLRHGKRIAVVSENDQLLAKIRREAGRLGFRCHELLRNEDLDLWQDQGDALASDLVVSRLEAVKGFEFDTVIACDLSQGVIPHPGVPEEEHWRQASVLYAALTRARDELIMTYVGEPSRFIKAMLADVEMHEATDETTLQEVLAIG